VRKKQRQNICCSSCFFFERNKKAFSTRNKLDRVVIVGGSNNAGGWGRRPLPPETNGGYSFSQKIRIFKHTELSPRLFRPNTLHYTESHRSSSYNFFILNKISVITNIYNGKSRKGHNNKTVTKHRHDPSSSSRNIVTILLRRNETSSRSFLIVLTNN